MTVGESIRPGEPIRVEMTKWGNLPHWNYVGIYLGTDEFGEWIGSPRGTRYTRPGRDFQANFGGVTLVTWDRAPHLATFNDENARSAIYVDITTPPVWDGLTLRANDLDLDVIRRQDGTVLLDDEDEFAEHQLSLGYPPEIIALAEQTAQDVFDAVKRAAPPYDGTAARWQAELIHRTTAHPPT